MQSNTKKLYNPTSISPSIFIIKYSKWVKRRKYGREENEENKWKYFTYVSFNLNYQFVCICAQTTKAFSLRKNFPNFPHHVFCLCLCFSFCVHCYRYFKFCFSSFCTFCLRGFFSFTDDQVLWFGRLILLMIRQHRGSRGFGKDVDCSNIESWKRRNWRNLLLS